MLLSVVEIMLMCLYLIIMLNDLWVWELLFNNNFLTFSYSRINAIYAFGTTDSHGSVTVKLLLHNLILRGLKMLEDSKLLLLNKSTQKNVKFYYFNIIRKCIIIIKII